METGNLELCRDEDERRACGDTMVLIEGRLKARETPKSVLKELEVSVKDYTWGTADLVVLWEHDAELWDYKFIRGVTVSEPKDNLQLRLYAAGVLEAYPEIESVTAGLIAPFLDWMPEPCVYTRDSLNDTYELLKTLLATINDVFKKPRPCDLCQVCANAGRCPALGVTAVTVASGIGLPMPSVFAPEAVVAPEERAKAQVVARALTNWSEQILKANNEYLRGGGELPGHTVVKRKGTAKIGDIGTALDILRVHMSAEQILATATLSLPKLAEALALMNSQSKDDSRAYLDDILKDVVVRGPDVVYAQRKKGSSDSQILLG
jgi:hypothetical protein